MHILSVKSIIGISLNLPMSINTFSPPPLPLPPILSYTKKAVFLQWGYYIVSLTLRVHKLKQPSGPIELDLEAGNLVNSIFRIFAKFPMSWNYGFHSKDTHIEGLWRPKDGSKSGSGLRIEDTKSGQIEGFEPSTSTLIIFESILRPIEVSMSTKKVFLG